MTVQHLRPVSLSLSHDADIESGVEKFRRRELAEREDGTIESVGFPLKYSTGQSPVARAS